MRNLNWFVYCKINWQNAYKCADNNQASSYYQYVILRKYTPQLSRGTIDKSNSRSDRIRCMYAHRSAIKDTGKEGAWKRACHARCTFVYTGVARMSGRAQLASYLSLGGECRGVRAATSHRVARATRLRLCFFCGMCLVLGVLVQ